ncbi:MAG: hypothetical protein FIA97_18550 [Methylococcaceae bacterium]|nr:hypothetical protein [Methylococcaceae bacterium]
MRLLGSLPRGHFYRVIGRVFQDASFQSAAEATIAARWDMIHRFESAARAAGLTAQCSANCGEDKAITWRTYRLSGGSEPLWAAMHLSDVEPAPSDPNRDTALGFVPIWQSAMLKDGEGATTHALVISRSEPKAFEKGNYGHVSVIAWNNPKAQKVLREMTRDGRYVFAWNFFNDQQVAAWKGRLFIHKKDTSAFSDRANLIEYEILE